jgi:DNA-binding response OmpR family regulator
MLLIVDDDPTFLEEVEKHLGPAGGFLFARNADHARQLLRGVGPSFTVVMVDLDLPGQDGFSFLQELRAFFPELPLIAISGVCHEHLLEIAKVCGAGFALQKPIGPESKTALAAARGGG